MESSSNGFLSILGYLEVVSVDAAAARIIESGTVNGHGLSPSGQGFTWVDCENEAQPVYITDPAGRQWHPLVASLAHDMSGVIKTRSVRSERLGSELHDRMLL